MVPMPPGEALAALRWSHNTCPSCFFATIRRRPLPVPSRKPRRSPRCASAFVTSSTDQPRRRATVVETSKSSRHGSISSSDRRSYTTTNTESPPSDIAVLGGGLTGLTTAYYLARFLPKAKITIYEAGDRLGGWVRSDKVQVSGADGNIGTVVFERGPRAVMSQGAARFDDFVLWDLVDQLELRKALAPISKKASKLMKRYVFYPDHLVAMVPAIDTSSASDTMATCIRFLSFIKDLMTEPVYQGAVPSAWHVFQQMSKIQSAGQTRVNLGTPLADVSIGDFFTRVLGRPEMVNNILSAVVHGVYGGDLWKLSIESSMFHRTWLDLNMAVPRREGHVPVAVQDMELWTNLLQNPGVHSLAEESASWGYVGFSGGFAALTDALVRALQANPNVKIRLNEKVTELRLDESQRVAVNSTCEQATALHRYDNAISTLFSKTLASLCPPNALPSLANSDAVTIQVVNLWYPQPYLRARHRGFGCLVPLSAPLIPVDQNPECALGVLFDSDRETMLPGLPYDRRRADGSDGDTVPGTKLTVMLGGHHWDGLPAPLLPDETEAISLARSVVARHLGIPASEAPAAASAFLARDCIPQHRVGHFARMRAAGRELERAFHGRLAVAGGSYTAQGVLPALRAGRDVAVQVAGLLPPALLPSSVGETGLARFERPLEKLVLVRREEVPYRFGNAIEWLKAELGGLFQYAA